MTGRLIFVIFLMATVGGIKPAHAYLDPGTGSLILQVLLGGIAGALVVGRLYWQKVKALFGIKSRSDIEEENAEGSQKGDNR